MYTCMCVYIPSPSFQLLSKGNGTKAPSSPWSQSLCSWKDSRLTSDQLAKDWTEYTWCIGSWPSILGGQSFCCFTRPSRRVLGKEACTTTVTAGMAVRKRPRLVARVMPIHNYTVCVYLTYSNNNCTNSNRVGNTHPVPLGDTWTTTHIS